jgi:hypothetical protein
VAVIGEVRWPNEIVWHDEQRARQGWLAIVSHEDLATLAQAASGDGLPELPTPRRIAAFYPGQLIDCYTADQMHAYGEQCRLATPEQPLPLAAATPKVAELLGIPVGTLLWDSPPKQPGSAVQGEAECPHEAWEENGGWCRCVDCGHGWRADATPPPAPAAEHCPKCNFTMSGIKHCVNCAQPEAREEERKPMIRFRHGDPFTGKLNTLPSAAPAAPGVRVDDALSANDKLMLSMRG